MTTFKVRGTAFEPHVRTTMAQHPLLERFKSKFGLEHETAAKILGDSVVDAMELLGGHYVTSMTQVVGRLTRLREAIHLVYEKVLSGTGETVDREALRRAFDQLHEETRRLADPQKWAAEEGRLVEPLPETAPQPLYPGARPGLADKPSGAPRQGEPVRGRPGESWKEQKVRRGEIALELDAQGLFWRFPEVPEGTVLHFEDFGYRVWKEPGGAIVEELLVGPSVSRTRRLTRGEDVIFSAAEMGKAYQDAATERAHGAGSPGLGFDAGYGVAHAIQRINGWLENTGVEQWVRNLRDNAPPGVEYLWTTRTRKSGQKLAERQYNISALVDGTVHDLYTLEVSVPPGPPDAHGPIDFDVVGVGRAAEEYGFPPTRESLDAWQAAPADAKPELTYLDPPNVVTEALGRTGKVHRSTAHEAAVRTGERLARLTEVLDTTILKRVVKTGDPGWSAAIDDLSDIAARLDTRVKTARPDPARLALIDAAITAFNRRAQHAQPADLTSLAAQLRALLPGR